MAFKHIFKAKTQWSSSKGESTLDARSYNRNHTVSIKGKSEPLQVSSAKIFRGDDALYNPEDMLLSAVSSCHMMSYFYVCSQNGIEVVAYEDQAEGVLEVDNKGKGQFVSMQLNPVVVVSKQEMVEKAESLHEQANALCFIANSCNFPISHRATIQVK
ncbi:OsmC family protein [Lacinutrix sp. MEBiC02595]